MAFPALCRALGGLLALLLLFFFLQSQKIKCNVATCPPPAAPEPRPAPGCLPLPGHLSPHPGGAAGGTLQAQLPPPLWFTTATTTELLHSSARPASLEVGFSPLPASVCRWQAEQPGSTHTPRAQHPLASACPQQMDVIAWGSAASAFSCPGDEPAPRSVPRLQTSPPFKCWKNKKKKQQPQTPRLTRSSWCLEFCSKRKKEASAKGQ